MAGETMDAEQVRISAEEIEEFARRLALREDLDVPAIRWRAHGGKDDACVNVLASPPVLRISTTLLANPARARAAVAHEIGHMMNARDGVETPEALRHIRRAASILLGAAGLFLIVAGMAVLGLVPTPLLAVSLGVVVVGALAVMRWAGLRQRPFEIAADLGYPTHPTSSTPRNCTPA